MLKKFQSLQLWAQGTTHWEFSLLNTLWRKATEHQSLCKNWCEQRNERNWKLFSPLRLKLPIFPQNSGLQCMSWWVFHFTLLACFSIPSWKYQPSLEDKHSRRCSELSARLFVIILSIIVFCLCFRTWTRVKLFSEYDISWIRDHC